MNLFFVLCRRSVMHFMSRQGPTLAASSAYFGILALIPFALLLIKGVGLIFGEKVSTKEQIFNLGASLVPKGGPEFLSFFQNLVEAPLFASESATWLNLILLFVCSLSFFKSLSKGIYSLADKNPHLSLKHFLKGIVLMAGSIVFVGLSLLLPSFVYFIEYIATHNDLMDFLGAFIPGLEGLLTAYQSNSIGKMIFVRTPIFSALFFLVYFTGVYKWFLGQSVRLKDAALGAIFFVFFLVVGKYLFLFYIFRLRAGMVGNFGDYYTVILGFTWIYLFLSFFFLGAAFAHLAPIVYRENASGLS